MSVFEIEGVAKREVDCDIANIEISFRASGKNAYEVSRKVMEQCDSFLEMVNKAGIKSKDFSLGDDTVNEARYSDEYDVYAERSINVKIPFDMKNINFIQETLQDGKFDYEISIDGDLSNRSKLHTELSKEALIYSKHEAEQLAEVLGLKVKGVDSIRQSRWDDDDDEMDYLCCEQEIVRYKKCDEPRHSDEISAKKITESVNLKIKWILE